VQPSIAIGPRLVSCPLAWMVDATAGLLEVAICLLARGAAVFVYWGGACPERRQNLGLR